MGETEEGREVFPLQRFRAENLCQSSFFDPAAEESLHTPNRVLCIDEDF